MQLVSVCGDHPAVFLSIFVFAVVALAVLRTYKKYHSQATVQTPPTPRWCQVLTKAKRAEIRARKDEIDRLEKEAKKTMVRMEDQDEMLAAAGSIPVPARQEFQEHGDGGGGGRATERNDRKRARSTLSTGGGGDEEGKGCRFGERDPLTAWVYDCYNHDDYTGHVSDLRHFLKGIDFYHVRLRVVFAVVLLIDVFVLRILRGLYLSLRLLYIFFGMEVWTLLYCYILVDVLTRYHDATLVYPKHVLTLHPHGGPKSDDLTTCAHP